MPFTFYAVHLTPCCLNSIASFPRTAPRTSTSLRWLRFKGNTLAGRNADPSGGSSLPSSGSGPHFPTQRWDVWCSEPFARPSRSKLCPCSSCSTRYARHASVLACSRAPPPANQDFVRDFASAARRLFAFLKTVLGSAMPSVDEAVACAVNARHRVSAVQRVRAPYNPYHDPVVGLSADTLRAWCRDFAPYWPHGKWCAAFYHARTRAQHKLTCTRRALSGAPATRRLCKPSAPLA